MTVKHLQAVQRQRFSAAVASDPSVIHKFKTGFNECATEVSRYISGLEGIDTGVKKRLVSHLSSCISGLPPISVPSLSGGFPAPELRISSAEDLNNNDASRFQVPGLQLIPSRLPSGELALLLPNSTTLSSLFPNTLDLSGRSHTSAFTPVSKDVKLTPGSDEPLVKYDNSHSEVTSTSNDGLSFKSSSGDIPIKSHPNISSSSLLIPVTELNPDYKMDTYGLSTDRSSVFKPLTVYTDPCFELGISSKPSPVNGKSPLDFSIKKEPQESPSSTNRLSRKRPLEDLPCNIQLPVKSTKLEMKKESTSDRNFATSSSEDISTGRDMWRPW